MAGNLLHPAANDCLKHMSWIRAHGSPEIRCQNLPVDGLVPELRCLLDPPTNCWWCRGTVWTLMTMTCMPRSMWSAWWTSLDRNAVAASLCNAEVAVADDFPGAQLDIYSNFPCQGKQCCCNRVVLPRRKWLQTGGKLLIGNLGKMYQEFPSQGPLWNCFDS